MALKNIQVSEIQIDTSKVQLSTRRIDEFTVQQYVLAISSGAEFPPITVFDDGEAAWLADGFHRLAAFRFLNRDSVLAEIKEGTREDAAIFAAIANVTHGRPMSQAQKREAGKRLLKLTEWSDREIGRRLAVSPRSVANWRPSAQNCADGPARTVTRGNTTYEMNTAGIGKNSVPKDAALAFAVIEAQTSGEMEWTPETDPCSPEFNAELALDELMKVEENNLPDSTHLITGDFAEVAQTLKPSSFDAIITDPPYPKEFLYLYELLAEQSARLLKDGGVLLAMCGESYLPQILSSISKYLTYRWTVCYLVPAPHVQIWDRQILCGWKPVVVFMKGSSIRWAHDVVNSPELDKRYHKWGQSVGGMIELVKRFTEAGDLILDPFVGGGTTAIAALQMSRRFVGIDIDEDAIEQTRKRLLQHDKTTKG